MEPGRLLDHFWEMFAIDALLGNFDRHNGNWGFLYDPVSKATGLAPVYACGSCLLPQADESVMQSVLDNEDALNKRVFQFPTSAVKLDGRKIKNTPYISDLQKAFYKKYIRARASLVLAPAHEMILALAPGRTWKA